MFCRPAVADKDLGNGEMVEEESVGNVVVSPDEVEHWHMICHVYQHTRESERLGCLQQGMDVWEEVPVYELVPVRVDVDGTVMDAHCYIMPEPPEHYEVVPDSCIASIPLNDIIRDVESMFGRFYGAEDKDR